MKNHKKVIWVIFFLIAPFIYVPVVFFLLKFLLTITSVLPTSLFAFQIEADNYIIELKDFMYYYVYFLTAIITAVFSYSVLKASKESNKLAKKIQHKEEVRDLSVIQENATIIYYDFILGFSDIIEMIKDRNGKQNLAPARLYFSNDWINKVASLGVSFSHDEMQSIYLLYGSFKTINIAIDSSKDAVLKKELVNLLYKVFSEETPNSEDSMNVISSIGNGVQNGFANHLNKKYRKIITKLNELMNK